jgi:hypothetical protein
MKHSVLLYEWINVWNQKHLESVEMWFWRKTEISWSDNVRNKEVLLIACNLLVCFPACGI